MVLQSILHSHIVCSFTHWIDCVAADTAHTRTHRHIRTHIINNINKIAEWWLFTHNKIEKCVNKKREEKYQRYVQMQVHKWYCCMMNTRISTTHISSDWCVSVYVLSWCDSSDSLKWKSRHFSAIRFMHLNITVNVCVCFLCMLTIYVHIILYLSVRSKKKACSFLFKKVKMRVSFCMQTF